MGARELVEFAAEAVVAKLWVGPCNGAGAFVSEPRMCEIHASLLGVPSDSAQGAEPTGRHDKSDFLIDAFRLTRTTGNRPESTIEERRASLKEAPERVGTPFAPTGTGRGGPIRAERTHSIPLRRRMTPRMGPYARLCAVATPKGCAATSADHGSF